MREYRWIRVEREDDGVRLLTLNKPPVNALGREMVDELTHAAERLAGEPAE